LSTDGDIEALRERVAEVEAQVDDDTAITYQSGEIDQFVGVPLPAVRVYIDGDDDYVAVGPDGEVARNSSDAAPVIENPITSTATSFNNGVYSTDLLGTVRTAPGLYDCNSKIYISGGMRGLLLIGSYFGTMLRYNSTGDFIQMNIDDDGYSAQHVIKDLQIKDAEGGSGNNGIHAYVGATNFIRIIASGFATAGILLDKDTSRSYVMGENYIRECNLVGNHNGLEVQTNDCEVADTISHGNDNFGIFASTAGGGANISDSHIWGNGFHGIQTAGDSTRLVNVESEDNTGDGLTVDNAAHVGVIGCNIWQNDNHQIQIFGAHA
jgi:hypothetical protein